MNDAFESGRSWIAALLLAAVGCGAPAPLDLRDFESREARFAPPPPTAAETAARDILGKDELTLADVLRIADMMNPTLEIERKNVDLATAAIWDAKLYPNPSIQFSSEDYRTRDGASLGRSKRRGGFTVPVVIGGRIGAATDLAEKEREVAAIQYVWRRREILSDVKRAYLQVLSARRGADLAKQTRDIAKTLHDVTNERFKAQTVPEMELLKAAVNLAKAEADLKLADKDVAVAVKTLHAGMGDVDLTQEKFADELHSRFTMPDFEALRGQVLGGHPLLEAARMGKEAAESGLDLAESEAVPDMAVSVGAGLDSEDSTIVEGGIEVPLPIFHRNQGKISAAEIRIRQAEMQIHAARNDLLLRLTEAYKNFAAAQERAAAYTDEILPKAQKALDQTNDGYSAGKFGYLDVLDAQRTLAESRLAHVAALADLNDAATELEKLTGMKLEPIQ